MQTRFPRSFFALQLEFAQRIATRFSLSLADALFHYTTFSKSLHVEDDWQAYVRRLATTDNMVEQTYQVYLERRGNERLPQPADTTFHDHALFGCFYYVVRGATIIRPHFINNDQPGIGPLGQARFAIRRAELRRMFAHIRVTVPAAATVLGNSWLYNLPAYTRLYPPSYTARMVENMDGEFQMLAHWAQCYDRVWEVKPTIGEAVLDRVKQVPNITELRCCFPYQLLQPQAPIAAFYTEYGISI